MTSKERELVSQVLLHFHGNRYHLFCFVVMNDHVHVLFRPAEKVAVGKIMHSWKSFTANRLQRLSGRLGSVWQDEYHDRIMRNEKQFYSTVRYILNNPRKRWRTEEYPWAWYNSDDAGTEARAPE